MILEAIVTTRNADGSTNIAPMGPHCNDPEMQSFELRPFQSSSTWQNLSRNGQGVLHITDDVLWFAQAATRVKVDARLEPAIRVDCDLLPDACRSHEFVATWIDAGQERAVVQCRTVQSCPGFR